ncbi:MAG: ribulose-phosphate 3-epimerase [bacterium]|nr:ribulose-phosphate 3-epimerase [bacterium]
MKLAPSILAADLANLAAELRAMEASGCDSVHWDVMDGHFVPNLTFGVPVIKAARAHCKLPFDVHLMVTNPAPYVPLLGGLGVTLVSFQIEVTSFAPRMCALVREHGLQPSVALNPQSPLSALDHVLDLVGNVLFMSIEPGFTGQEFMPHMWGKLEALAALRSSRGQLFTIQVDGGVNAGNLARLAAIGVDNVVAGKAYFSAADRSAFAQLVHGA